MILFWANCDVENAHNEDLQVNNATLTENLLNIINTQNIAMQGEKEHNNEGNFV